MITLQDLIDFAKKNEIDPSKCTMLLHEEWDDGKVSCEYFDKCFKQRNIKVEKFVDDGGKYTGNNDDYFDKVEVGISLRQLHIPDFMGN